MYESPLTLAVKEMAEQTVKQLDEATFKAVYSVMPTVDKDELIRALRYDRGQYDKGYADGRRDAMDELVRCKDCKHCVLTVDGEYNPEDIVCDWWATDGVKANDFCSYGERRGEDEEAF